MRPRLRSAAGVSAVLVFSAACNAILGIDDLADPGPSRDDGGLTDAPSGPDAASSLDASPDVRSVDAADAAIPRCVEGSLVDPCLFVEPQMGAVVYPTWPITYNLTMKGQNVAVVQPVRPNYVDAGADGVLETRSQLSWQLLDGGYTFAAAGPACAALGTRWHVPSFAELATTQHHVEITEGAQTFCTPPELPTSSNRYGWTTTHVPDTVPDNRYVLDEVGCGAVSNPSEGGAAHGVRCVRGASRPATFIVSTSKDSVVAVETGLEWERKGIVVAKIADGKAHCDALGWRLPNIQEIYAIVDRRTTSLFHPVLFELPRSDAAAAPRIILSQTVSGRSGGAPYYQGVALNNGPWGFEDGASEDDGQVDVLIRCVH